MKGYEFERILCDYLRSDDFEQSEIFITYLIVDTWYERGRFPKKKKRELHLAANLHVTLNFTYRVNAF